jgi:hypothetical protein
MLMGESQNAVAASNIGFDKDFINPLSVRPIPRCNKPGTL